MTSFVFNEAVGLRVHNQQEYKLIVDHEFVDILGWQWSLHAMVLHIGVTKNEGHFVVYVVFQDKWWLCHDGTVKGTSPHSAKSNIPVVQAQANQSDGARHVTLCLPTNKGFSP